MWIVFGLLLCVKWCDAGELSSVQPLRFPASIHGAASIHHVQERTDEAQDGVAPVLNAGSHSTISEAPVHCLLTRWPSEAKQVANTDEGEGSRARSSLVKEYRPQFDKILNDLHGKCAEPFTASSGFSYTFCVNQHVKQAAGGNTYTLGASLTRHSDLPFNSQRYGQGDACAALVRQTVVSWMCGQTFSIVSAAEPSMCQYTLVVTHPDLCTLPESLMPRVSEPTASIMEDPFVESLPEHVRNKLKSMLTPPQQQQPASSSAAATGKDKLSTADVPGIGGATIGKDDRYRVSKLWSGLSVHDATSSSAQTQASWALEIHHEVHERNTAARRMGHAVVSCTLFATDELRKSGGSVGVDTNGAASSAAAATTTTAAFGSVDAFALFFVGHSKAEPRIVYAAARGVNRRNIRIDEAGSPISKLSATDCANLGLLQDRSDVDTAGLSCWGGLISRENSPADLEFVSMIAEVPLD